MKAFFEVPSNRAGISAWIATVLTMLVQCLLSHAAPLEADLLGIVIGFVAILQPDNSVSVTELEKAISDVRTAMQEKSQSSIDAAISDAAQIAAQVITPAKPNT